MTNKATEIRESLNLSKREAGELFTGNLNQSAYDVWARWERTGNWPAPAEQLFKIILSLKMAEEFKTKNCSGALKLVLKMLEADDDLD